MQAGIDFLRVDRPDQLPPATSVELLVVDWGAREDSWAEGLRTWLGAEGASAPRVILFGPHTDLEAHAAARNAGLGPMRARSALLTSLPGLLRP